MELLVVGAGTMGQWVARTVDADVAFADVDEDAAEAAAATVGGRTVPIDGDERFDAVCLAVPMSAVAQVAAQQAHRARDAIFDVAGEMGTPIDAMAEHAADVERASLHPLFAPSNAPGNVAVVRQVDGPTIDAILDDIAAAGNDLVETTPEEHDRAMESVQAAAHAAIVAYGLASDSVPEGFSTPVSSALDDLVEQVTDGDPGVYAEIQDTFEGAAAVAEAAERIDGTDASALGELLADAEPAAPRTRTTRADDADDGIDSEPAAADAGTSEEERDG